MNTTAFTKYLYLQHLIHLLLQILPREKVPLGALLNFSVQCKKSTYAYVFENQFIAPSDYIDYKLSFDSKHEALLPIDHWK